MPQLRTVIATAGLAAALLAGCVTEPAVTEPVVTEPTIVVAPPTGWTPVTDPGTGVSVYLPGPAQPDTETVVGPGAEAEGTVYSALEPSGRVEAVLHVSPLSRDERAAPQGVAEQTAHFVLGELAESRQLVVERHPAVDARIDGWSRQGGSGTGTLILRIIDTPAYEVIVEANSDIADATLAQQVFEQVNASLRIP
jgi:hypothetical protein